MLHPKSSGDSTGVSPVGVTVARGLAHDLHLTDATSLAMREGVWIGTVIDVDGCKKDDSRKPLVIAVGLKSNGKQVLGDKYTRE